jgi:hypothetical protein
MRVGVKRGADSRRIVDLEERHLVTPDKWLDEHIAAIQRLAFDGAYRHSLDVSISRLDQVDLRFFFRQAARDLQIASPGSDLASFECSA